MSNCIFCNTLDNEIVDEYMHFFIIRDLFPVKNLHSLVISKRHIVSYFECNKDEYDEIPLFLNTQKTELKLTDDTITGFNIGMNVGEDAGHTIFHFHIHIIPTRKGDIYNSKGGIEVSFQTNKNTKFYFKLVEDFENNSLKLLNK